MNEFLSQARSVFFPGCWGNHWECYDNVKISVYGWSTIDVILNKIDKAIKKATVKQPNESKNKSQI